MGPPPAQSEGMGAPGRAHGTMTSSSAMDNGQRSLSLTLAGAVGATAASSSGVEAQGSNGHDDMELDLSLGQHMGPSGQQGDEDEDEGEDDDEVRSDDEDDRHLHHNRKQTRPVRLDPLLQARGKPALGQVLYAGLYAVAEGDAFGVATGSGAGVMMAGTGSGHERSHPAGPQVLSGRALDPAHRAARPIQAANLNHTEVAHDSAAQRSAAQATSSDSLAAAALQRAPGGGQWPAVAHSQGHPDEVPPGGAEPAEPATQAATTLQRPAGVSLRATAHGPSPSSAAHAAPQPPPAPPARAAAGQSPGHAPGDDDGDGSNIRPEANTAATPSRNVRRADGVPPAATAPTPTATTVRVGSAACQGGGTPSKAIYVLDDGGFIKTTADRMFADARGIVRVGNKAAVLLKQCLGPRLGQGFLKPDNPFLMPVQLKLGGQLQPEVYEGIRVMSAASIIHRY